MTTDLLKSTALRARVEQAQALAHQHVPVDAHFAAALAADLWAEVERLTAAVADNHKAIDYYGDVAERAEAERSNARDDLLRMTAERDAMRHLCRDAADMLNEPTATGGETMDAMADRLRAAAEEATRD